MKLFSKKLMFFFTALLAVATFSACSSDDEGTGGSSGISYSNLWPAYSTADKLYGYIDRNGNMLVTPQYVDADYFSCGLALVDIAGNKSLYIGTDGKMKTGDASFDTGYTFQNNYARVRKDGLYGIIDRNINYVLQPLYYRLGNVADNGLILCKRSSGGNYGYINIKGDIVIDFQYEDATGFVDGVAVVKSGTKYGIIDATGKYVIAPKYNTLYSAYGNRLIFSATTNGTTLYGLLDTNGKEVVPAIYNSISSDEYRSGRFLVRNSTGKYGYIDVNGNVVIPFQYTDGTEFNEGYAYVKLESGASVIIDGTGTVKLTLESGEYVGGAEAIYNGLIRVQKYESGTYIYKYIDINGNVVYQWVR